MKKRLISFMLLITVISCVGFNTDYFKNLLTLISQAAKEVIYEETESSDEETTDSAVDHLEQELEKLNVRNFFEDESETESGGRFGFTEDEINNLKNAVISEGQRLKDIGYTKKQLGPAIAGAYDRATGKIYIAINDCNGNLPKEMAPIIEERINNMPQEVRDSYERTKGAGSHAEVYAVNELLLDNPNARIEDIAVYVNRTLGPSKPVVEVPFETCIHCRYILDGFNIISNE